MLNRRRCFSGVESTFILFVCNFLLIEPFKGIKVETSKYTGDINAQDADGKTVFHHLVTSLPIGNFSNHGFVYLNKLIRHCL